MKKEIKPFASVLMLGFLVWLGGLTNSGAAPSVEIPILDPSNFDQPHDNVYFPRTPGLTYVYLAEDEEEVVLNEITTTDRTKEILGVTCTVVRDVEWVLVEGIAQPILTEETEDWYAWDNEGNAWYLGEDTTAFEYDEDWNLIGTSKEGSWEAGVGGALAGILMPAQPALGKAYRQEYKQGEAEDLAKALRLDVDLEIGLGDFEGCLVTKEWTPLGPGGIEHKFYAPGVGLVFIEELKGKTVRVELVDIH